MKKLLFLLSLITMIIISCGNGNKGLTINIVTEPSSIDPQITTDIAGGTVDDLIMEGLARKDKDGKSVPGLAEKWEVSQDGLKWTFHLRDAVWANGDKVTAQDFKAGWMRELNPNTAAENAYLMFMIKGAEDYNSGKGSADAVGIKVVDDKTLEVELAVPTAYFDDLTTFKAYMPVNEKFLAEKGDKYFAEDVANTLAVGPYILKEWNHDSELKLEKNPKYWDAKNVKVDNITLKLMEDSTASFNAFKNKEIDVTKVTFQQAKEYAGKPELVKAADGGVWYLLLNNNIKPLNNAKVRKALQMAVNREKLIESVLENSEKLNTTFTPSGIGINGQKGDFASEVPTKIAEFNVDEAKKLLAEGLKEEGMTKMPELEMIFADSGSTKAIAEYVQETLGKNLGINLKLSIVTGKERIKRSKQRDYQIAIANWTGDFKDPITYLDIFDSTNKGANRGDFTNARYDELSKIAKSTADPAVRVPAMIEMEQIIADQVPVVVLFQRQKTYLVNPKVQGLGFVAIGGEFNFRDLFMAK